MRKISAAVLIYIMSAMLLAGCAASYGNDPGALSGSGEEPEISEEAGDEAGTKEKPEISEEAGDEAGTKEKPEVSEEAGDEAGTKENPKVSEEAGDEAGTKEKPEVSGDAGVRLASEEEILSYLAGEWTLIDRKTGHDHGTLAIREDGSFEFTRLSDKARGTGTLKFDNSLSKKGEEPDLFRMDIDDCKDFLPEDYELYGDEGCSGAFHTGRSAGEDYLYLKEIGNGDSIVSAYMFNTQEGSGEIGDWSYDWLLCRDSDTEDSADAIKNDTFYAWAWKKDKDGLWLQRMTEHVSEMSDEYTEFRYLGGFFGETDDIGIAHYGIGNSADLRELVNTKDWNSTYPLMMCEVTADGEGNVVKVRDIDIMMYNSYYMGEVEPEFSYKDRTFTINGIECDITPYAPVATAITDAVRVGDWIILDCHVNPNIGIYLFYNIPDGFIDEFEYQIGGSNLIWQGDDLSTAVYAQYNDIYDIWGHHIGHIDDGELYELSFKDQNTIVAGCRVIDEAGREKEFTREFEYEPCDSAVWAYYEYLLGGSRQWRRLKNMAGDATALIIVDPPEMVRDRMPYPVGYEKGALDKVAVVPLVDDAKVTAGPALNEALPGNLPGDVKEEYTEEVEKGRAVVFDITAPEGMPVSAVTVEAPGCAKATWDVMQLSGRNPQMSTFIR